ncbi:MAG: hypothetical protein R2873_03450 [Caldilineaceae bacterium]|nr:hypothetical protein [Caldilineaceae bacterium]
MSRRTFSILLVFTLFVASSLACSGGRLRINRAEPTPTPRAVAVSEQSAQEAQQAVATAVAGGTLRLTEAQFTSLIAGQLTQDIPVSDVTVWFDPGVITVGGVLAEGAVPMVSGPLTIKGTLAAENGVVTFDITEAVINGMFMPGAATNAIERQVNEALATGDLGTRVRSITINQGEIVIEQE